MRNTNKQEFGEIEEGFAANDELQPFSTAKRSKKTQKQPKIIENGSAIDKRLVKSIQKEEKKQLKQTRKQEKATRKENKKSAKRKLKELIKQKRLEDKQIRLAQEQTIRELEKRGRLSSWFRLDNAASIYPSAKSSDWNFVFRITANLKEEVDPGILQGALDDIMARFPSFNVRLCHGFFWNYYERNFSRLKVEKETDFPCRPFNLNDSEGFLLRVLYSKQKISLEVFHAITDGRGALFFLNSLLARYLEKKGIKISEFVGCTSYLDLPSDDEIEDSFMTSYTNEKLKRPKERPAYKIKGNPLPGGMVNTIEGEMSVEKVKQIAHEHDASVTEFLTAIVGYAIYKKRKNNKRPTRISIPIDLRPRYNSKTMRNFSSYINIEIDGQDLNFDDVLKIVKEKLNALDVKFLQANINANVSLQKNLFVKILPLFIKNIILKNCFNYFGENYQTLSLSNLGSVSAPKEFENFVESYCFNLGRSMHNEKSIGVASYNGKLNICISSKLYETETERDIFSLLASLGVDVKVYSNRRDLYGAR